MLVMISLLAIGLTAGSCQGRAQVSPRQHIGEDKDGIMYFWHVTDFHYDPRYKASDKSSMATKKEADRQRDYFLGDYDPGCWTDGRGKFGDYDCDAPMALIQSAVEFMRTFNGTEHIGEPGGSDLRNITDVDFVVWTGDDTSHANDSYFNVSNVLEANRAISGQLGRLKMDTFAVLGNHDVHPKNQMPPDNESSPELATFYQEVADIWSEEFSVAGDDNLDKYFDEFAAQKGFYAFKYDDERIKWKIIGLNSNLWYKSNHLVGAEDPDPAGQLSWLRTQLKSASNEGLKVILLSHIPPGKFERFYQRMEEVDYNGFHWMDPRFNKLYLEIIGDYEDAIVGQLYAHHHTDTFKLFKKQESEEVTGVGLLAPGVTPWRSTLATETGANNPGIRLFKANRVTGELLDYYQFYLDLAAANANGAAEWKLEYSARTQWRLPDLSPASWSRLADQLNTDRTMFNEYYGINTVQFETALDANTTCDNVCHMFHMCAVFCQDYQEFENCTTTAINKAASETNLSAGTFLFAIIVYWLHVIG